MLDRIFRNLRFRCPGEHQLAAYVDQQLIGAERGRVESHLAKCDSCLEQVGFLTKQAQVVPASVPEGLIRRAERFETAAHGTAPQTWEWATAALAIVVVVGSAVWREARQHMEGSPTVVATTPQPQVPDVTGKPNLDTETSVRSVSPHVSLPVVLAPQPGATVHTSDFIIRWEPIPNATAYEVRVVTAEGDPVWGAESKHAFTRTPADLRLRTGKYFVWVRAHLRDGRTLKSDTIGFRIANSR